MNVLFRPLTADEIEIRVDRITPKGAWLLLFKNARVDMNILDETVGPMNWKRGHEVIHDNLFCNISIWDSDKKEWVTKQDVGVESFSAKEKGEASDSFKRAGTCWGIGRELYTAPDIFVPCKTKQKSIGNGYELEDAYSLKDIAVSHILTVDGQIKELAIVDKRGNVIFSNVGKSVTPIDPTEPPDEIPDLNAKISMIQKKALEDRLKNLGWPVEKICTNYKIKSLSEMTIAQCVDCNRQLTGIEDKRRKQAKEGEI
jgi:hypothetical protein